MNLFQIVFLDVVMLVFPVLVFLIYLSTNKNINEKSKKMYMSLTLITSMFMIHNYGVSTPKILPILVLNAVVILSYLVDQYILANIFSIGIIFLYMSDFNCIWILIIIYVLAAIIYFIRKKRNMNTVMFVQLFILISIIVYSVWIYCFNKEYYSLHKLLLVIISYAFIVNIICLMYEIGKDLLQTHLTFKELQQEKQIRLSLFKITHEIKNPIAVCKCYLDMINVNDLAQVKRYVPIIKSEVERLLSLLQDFLLINRGSLDLDIMDVSLLVEDSLGKLKPLLEKNNIKVRSNIIDDEIFINGDYNRLSQVLINVLKNSIEAIPDDKNGIINISSKIKQNNYYLIIDDNGIGISSETMKKIREPFFTTKKRGSGLGVSLIYEIMEAHNGKIEYESEYGKGTRVILQFPLYE